MPPSSNYLDELDIDFNILHDAISGQWRPEDIEFHCSAEGDWQAISASVIGASHRKEGSVRQDSYALEFVGDICVAIVADGLGSEKLSHVASSIACMYLIDTLIDYFRKEIGPRNWEKVLAFAIERISTIASALSKKSEETGIQLLTTLLIAIAGTQKGFFLNLGDGAALAFSKAERADFSDCVLSEPEHGEYVGEVFPLLPEFITEHLRVRWFGYADRLLLMTDGVAEIALDETESSSRVEFISNFDSAMKSGSLSEATDGLIGYLDSERVNVATRDDKTIIWIRRLSNATS